MMDFSWATQTIPILVILLVVVILFVVDLFSDDPNQTDGTQLYWNFKTRLFNQIHFDLADISGVTVEVKLEDKGSSLSRAFKYNKFRSSGPAIKFDSLSQSAIRCNLYILTAIFD